MEMGVSDGKGPVQRTMDLMDSLHEHLPNLTVLPPEVTS